MKVLKEELIQTKQEIEQQYKEQLKALENRKADEERRKRTHLLIVCGSIVYLILGPIILLTSGYMKKK